MLTSVHRYSLATALLLFTNKDAPTIQSKHTLHRCRNLEDVVTECGRTLVVQIGD